MKDKLENFVRDNKRSFDQFEPPADLWDRIGKRLDENQKGKKERVIRLSILYRSAAVLIPVLFAGLWFYHYQYKQSVDLSNINPRLARQQVHYASMIDLKRSELKHIEKEEPQLYREFSSEIRKMEESYTKLQKDLPASPNQEETVKAMIRNLEIQIELLNQQLNIIQQINQVKKEQRNDTQNI
ncbi:hypothetical protein [Daejeonella sp. H1SJ63]|jgi:hypothetical protein|uniref:hypothetical protein n=1 Tax=Daejeonella sp. H1SJ63 TaxID=3034145 RepID=UPI0023EDDC73|nr:hypothetical protein [Daejeonella sp. H1SJ63]